MQKTLVLGVQDKTSLFWELRAPGFYLPREKAPSVEITFSAGKIRSDFRSGKCLGGKFLPTWKGSPDLPGDRGEPGREKEQQRFEPSSKRGSRSGAAPSPSPRGLHGNPARSGAADCSWEEQDGERKINVERHRELLVRLLAEQLRASFPGLPAVGIGPRVTEMRVAVAGDRARSPSQGPCAKPPPFPAIPGLLAGKGKVQKVTQIHVLSPFSAQEQHLLQSSEEQGGTYPSPPLLPTGLWRMRIFGKVCPGLGHGGFAEVLQCLLPREQDCPHSRRVPGTATHEPLTSSETPREKLPWLQGRLSKLFFFLAWEVLGHFGAEERPPKPPR